MSLAVDLLGVTLFRWLDASCKGQPWACRSALCTASRSSRRRAGSAWERHTCGAERSQAPVLFRCTRRTSFSAVQRHTQRSMARMELLQVTHRAHIPDPAQQAAGRVPQPKVRDAVCHVCLHERQEHSPARSQAQRQAAGRPWARSGSGTPPGHAWLSCPSAAAAAGTAAHSSSQAFGAGLASLLGVLTCLAGDCCTCALQLAHCPRAESGSPSWS